MSQEDFYIGWKEDGQNDHNRMTRRIVGIMCLLVLLLLSIIAVQQKPFNDHVFELGKLTQVTGVYFDKPVPILYADEGILPEGTSRDVLLIGYGKSGAEGIIDQIKSKVGKISGLRLTLEGTLIYGDGKTLLELTRKEDSFIQEYYGKRSQERNLMGEDVTMNGEILDPKCYFGVMKPGEGKVHKSCAIRCISGGIPPVFRQQTLDSERPYVYYILLGEDGKKINKEVLQHVGEDISVQGRTGKFINWDILYINPSDIELL